MPFSLPKRTSIAGLCFCLFVLLSGTASGTADVRKAPLTPEQVLNRRQFSDLQLSPDGNLIAFVLSEPVKGAEQKRNIWLYDLRAREMRHFTTFEKSDSHPRFSPDGKTLAFLSNRDGKTQIQLIPLSGGEALALTQSKTGIQAFAWSPGGKQIVFMADPPATEEEEKKQKDKDDARVVDRDEKNSLLSIIEVESRKVRQLSQEKWRISEFIWVPQGGQLIITATDEPQKELFSDRIFSLAVSDGKMLEISKPAGPFNELKVSPDGKALAYVGCRTDGPSAHDLFLQPLAGGPARNLTATTLDRPVDSFYWRPDGTIIAQVSSGFATAFVTLSQDGKIQKLNNLTASPNGSFVAGQKILAFVGDTAVKLPEIWVSSGPGKEEKISSFNKDWDSVPLVQPQIIRYPSFDGKEIEAALFLPAGDKQETKGPLIVLVHGGPTGAWSDSFNAWAQLLAARDFAVLCPNIRGSMGYGHDFMVMNRRDWGGGDFKDVMAGADFLVSKGIADPERLGIGGWSYGGYMAAWAVTQSTRFKASVSGAPMTDLAVEYGTEMTGINAYDTWFLGTPYENLSHFIDRSPTTFIKNVKTPTLILCGENDATDPIAQCYQFHRGLKRYGVEAEFVAFPREGHGLRDEKHQVDMLSRMINWFEKYLKPVSHQ